MRIIIEIKKKKRDSDWSVKEKEIYQTSEKRKKNAG